VALIVFLMVFANYCDVSMAQKCRSRGLSLASEEFLAETCALCYIYMPYNKFKMGDKWRLSGSMTVRDPSMGSRLTNSNGTIEVYIIYYVSR
jgi:hypothetical protein